MNWSVGCAIGRESLLDLRRGIGGATVFAIKRVKEDGDGCGVRRRRAALRMVDRQLAKGNFKLALSLVKQLQRQPPPAGLRGFAGARQGRSVTSKGNDLYLEDDVIEHKQVAQHEAGHFLVGYLLGVLPKKYSLFSMEDMKHDKIVDASVKFIGFEFLTKLEDVVLSKNLQKVKPGHWANKCKLSSTVLSNLSCVIVGGLVAEHLVFGYSKGHHADVEMLERVLKQCTEDEAKTLIRWCVLNTLVILHRHGEATSMLAEAMSHGRSIGNCIDIIEDALKNHQQI